MEWYSQRAMPFLRFLIYIVLPVISSETTGNTYNTRILRTKKLGEIQRTACRFPLSLQATPPVPKTPVARTLSAILHGEYLVKFFIMRSLRKCNFLQTFWHGIKPYPPVCKSLLTNRVSAVYPMKHLCF